MVEGGRANGSAIAIQSDIALPLAIVNGQLPSLQLVAMQVDLINSAT